VGNDVMIAPNTFVNFDVPDHSIVVENPASIHKKRMQHKDILRFA
jgi:serine O-acetyltransferase